MLCRGVLCDLLCYLTRCCVMCCCGSLRGAGVLSCYALWWRRVALCVVVCSSCVSGGVVLQCVEL